MSVRVTILISILLCLSAASARTTQSDLPIGASQPAPPMYRDVPTDHWAYVAVERLTDIGVLTGYPDGLFGGARTATRYELAVVGARIVNYLDSVLVLLSDDPDFVANLSEAAADLRELSSLPQRVERLELALENAASLAYARSLETRLVALEHYLNTMIGEEVFPAEMTSESGENADIPLSAADSVPPVPGMAGFGAEANSSVDGNSTALRFAPRNPHPFYIGISPGIVSTSGLVAIGVQVGYDQLVGPVGGVLRLQFNSGADELRLSLDATVRFTALADELEFYGGLGIGGSLRPSGNAFLIEAPFGLEYFVTPRVGLFAQLTPSYAFAPISKVDAALTAGVNLRF